MQINRRRGITTIPLIIALVFMISLAAFFISLLTGRHLGAPLLALTTKAFYISGAGIEFTEIYLAGYGDWTTVPDISATTFGGGTFAVVFTNKAVDSVTATSTGASGNAVRVISVDFSKGTSTLSENPVTTPPDGYRPLPPGGPTVYCQGGTPCDPASPLDNPPYDCLCNNYQEMPTPALPAGAPPAPWPDLTITGTYDFPAGTYYYNSLILKKQGSNEVRVTVSGVVTIWINTGFEMKNDSAFNYVAPAYTTPDDPANLLLISAATATFDLKNSARLSGAIYAPNGNVVLDNSAEINGAIAGNTVTLHNNAVVTHDTTAGVGSPEYTQTSSITAANWQEI